MRIKDTLLFSCVIGLLTGITAPVHANCMDFFSYKHRTIDYTESQYSVEPGRNRAFGFQITSIIDEYQCKNIYAKWESWNLTGRACGAHFSFSSIKPGEGRIFGSGTCAWGVFSGAMQYANRPIYYSVNIY